MVTLLGAGGSVSDELAKLLAAREMKFRLVSRSGHGAGGPGTGGAGQVVRANLLDLAQTVQAVAGSKVVYLLAGLKYDRRVWADEWPRIMDNAVEACRRAEAQLVFFDNVYMYGRVQGAMTEETPFHPTSKKGEIRARIATKLAEAWQRGELTGMIVRCADFYGPGSKNGIGNVLVFDPLSKGEPALCLATDAQPHSYSYVPDAAQALMTLAGTETAWNQTWHVPTAGAPPTGREFIEMAAEAMGKPAKYRVLSRTIVRMYGWVKPMVGEVREMMYQNDSPYLFDSTKYARAFGFGGTPYAEGVRTTAASYK